MQGWRPNSREDFRVAFQVREVQCLSRQIVLGGKRHQEGGYMRERMKKAFQVAVILALGTHANGQGTFQNLDFEQANPVFLGNPYAATIASALPYWTWSIGGVQYGAIGVNYPTSGAPSVTLLGHQILVPASPPLMETTACCCKTLAVLKRHP
jgi:hypothetical protein